MVEILPSCARPYCPSPAMADSSVERQLLSSGFRPKTVELNMQGAGQVWILLQDCSYQHSFITVVPTRFVNMYAHTSIYVCIHIYIYIYIYICTATCMTICRIHACKHVCSSLMQVVIGAKTAVFSKH